LDVLAMARGDAEESELLTNTCPKRDYVMNDWGFVGRWEAARELAMLTYMDLANCLDKIQMIEAFRVTLPYFRTLWENDTTVAYFEGHEAGSRYAWSKAGMVGDPPGWEEGEEATKENVDPSMDAALEEWAGKVGQIDERISEALDNLERTMAEEGLAVWSAFCGLCAEETGLEARKILAALGPFAERTRALEELTERLELEPDAGTVEEYCAILSDAWHRVLEKGS